MQLRFHTKPQKKGYHNKILFFVVLLFLFFSGYIVSCAGNILTPIYSRSAEIINHLFDLKDYFKTVDDYKSEILQLESRISELEYSLAEVSGYRDKISRLETVLDLKNELENMGKPSVAARVVSRYDECFVIDKGTNHRITIGDAVLSGKGIVGRVSEVFGNYGIVETVVSENFTLFARNVRSGGLCVLKGDSENMICESLGTIVGEGDIFEISGGYSGLPDGVLVGKSTGVFEKNGMIYSVITPFEDISQLKEVVIVLND